MAEPARQGFFASAFVTARVFAAFFALASLGFLVGAFAFGYSALTHERRVVATAQGNSLTLPAEGRQYTLTLYGTTASGEDPADVDCRLTTTSRSTVASDFGPTGTTLELDGRTLYRIGQVLERWNPGDVVTCSGLTEVAAVTPGPQSKMLFTAALTVAAVMGLLMSRFGYRERRRHAESIGRDR